MGLVGGPHCLAMCAAPCSVVTGQGGSTAPVEQPLRPLSRGGQQRRLWAYHLGRLLGYASVGALAAMAMQSLAWLTVQAAALRPAWTMLHVLVLAWGLMMVAQARQPAWVESAGRAVWGRVRPVVAAPGGGFCCWFFVVADAMRPVVFGFAGCLAQRRSAPGCSHHGLVCCGQRVVAVGGALGLVTDA